MLEFTRKVFNKIKVSQKVSTACLGDIILGAKQVTTVACKVSHRNRKNFGCVCCRKVNG